MSTLTNLARTTRGSVARLVERAPIPVTPLADPPAGSGLLPVMGRQGLPYVGEGLNFVHDPIALVRRHHEQYGPVSWSGFMGVRGVWVMGPDAVGEVLSNGDKAFANGPGWDYFLGPFFRRGIMLLDFEEHLAHKRIMQQAFSRDRLHRYLETMNTGIARGLSAWQPQQDFRMYDAIKQLLLDLGAEVFVGVELGDEATEVNQAFIGTVAAATAIVRADVPGTTWHRGITGRRLLERYFSTRVQAKRAGNGDDLFSVLCHAETEDGQRFSDEDIVNHMIFVLMAAHDTSTITATTMARYLAAYPDWQERLREESRALGKPTIEYADLERLPLMDQVFRESLRLNPPVGVVVRETVKDTQIAGHYVPQGTKVFVAPMGTHRVADYWPDPDTFDPDRFAPHRRDDRAHPYLWSPFGGGVHKCIGLYFGGMQVKAILHQMLLGHRWSIEPGYEPPMEYGTGLFPGDGLPVRWERLED